MPDKARLAMPSKNRRCGGEGGAGHRHVRNADQELWICYPVGRVAPPMGRGNVKAN